MTAARCLFGWPIVSDVNSTYAPSFDDGSWSGTLPLANLQDRRLAKVARSTSAAITSTKFSAHLGRQARVGLIALINHTISQAGSIRIRGFSALPVFDSLTIGDASWTAVGTPTRTPSAFTSSDGVPLDLIGDDSGAIQEYYTKALIYGTTAQKIVAVRIKKGTIVAAGGSALLLVDTTAGSAHRLEVTITWSGSVPSFAVTTGLLISTTLLPSGDYRVVFLTTTATLGNNHLFGAYGAVSATEQGNIYIGDLVTFEGNVDELAHEAGVRAVWPTNVYPVGALAAGDPRTGGPYTAEEAAYVNIGFTYVLPATTAAYHWKFEIFDTANTAGYVDLGRLVIADTIQPSINMSQGAKLALSSATTRTETDGGAAVYNDKPRRREQVFTIDYLTEDEALVNFLDMQRRLGTSGQLYFVHNAADTYHLHRRSFLCTMRELSAIEYPFGTRANVPFAVIEEL